ncbi:MAG: nucleotidyltransferase family protein [Patescibacteria group bacterium]
MMTENDILNLVRDDKWMMDTLRIAEDFHLPDWLIGAGFLRNKVWSHLHGYDRAGVDTNDIDLVYYDPKGNREEDDEKLSRELQEKTGINWEVVNEFYAHKWNNIDPYISSEDALSRWPETATGVGVRLEKGQLRLIAPHGISDLVNLIIRSSPKLVNAKQLVRERVEKKKWLTKWPKLRFVESD